MRGRCIEGGRGCVPAFDRHFRVGWSKGAVRAILTNPRYTGRQVWNKRRKDEGHCC